MDLRHWINLIESQAQGEEITEAFWWLQRWVSGSEDDPDWDESWLKQVFSFANAIPIIHKIVGNKRSVGKPLWRGLAVSKSELKQIAETRVLQPNQRGFQSFTDSRSVAKEFVLDVRGQVGIPIVVSASISPENILFGMKDVMASRHPAACEAVMSLEDWHNQNEIFVRVDAPLPLISVERIKN